MKKTIFIISKDCMSKESLSVYDNSFWNLPNIEELAEKGTVFTKMYTAAASTWMSLSAVFSQHYPLEFESRKTYTQVLPNEFPSIFTKLIDDGYECHIIWDLDWEYEVEKFVSEFGDKSRIITHALDIQQKCGSHNKNYNKRIVRNDEKLEKTLDDIYNAVDSIDYSKKQFVYMHLPHVLAGRISYMDDMDSFDRIVGYIREKVGDDSIYITTDHGHMNLHKGISGYGFDVYEPVINIPFISPRIDGMKTCDKLLSLVDFYDIVVNNKINEREYILSDNAYYCQPHRKLAIVSKRYKYIFNRKDSSEEFYDIEWDPYENFNILKTRVFDEDRVSWVNLNELYHYPYLDEAIKKADDFRKIKDNYWREPGRFEDLYYRIRTEVSKLKRRIKNK